MPLKVFSFGDEELHAIMRQSRDQLTLALRPGNANRTWGPSPLLALDIHDKCCRRVERHERYHIAEVKKVGAGIHAMVACGDHITVGLWLRVQEGELVVTVVPEEIYERKPEIYRLFSIDILPGLLRVKNGILLLPLGQGMMVHTADKPEIQDRFLIYMEQERWELMPTLPICGAADSKGGMGILVSKGACDADCRVATDGCGSGQVGFAASLRRFWPDPVDLGHREYRFFPAPAGEALAPCAAKRLRRHTLADLGKKTLEERRRESPEVDYLLQAYTFKLFHGMEREGYLATSMRDEAATTYHDYLSFSEAAVLLKRLRSAGVSKALTQSVGWNPRGHDGLYPTRFPINERAGGEAGFRQLVEIGRELGYQINVHDNFMMNLPHSPDWDQDCVTHDVYGQPLVHGWWAGGVEYATWGLALPEHRLQGHLRRMKTLGIEGIYYADYMMQPLEVNYHPKHRGGRSDCCRGMLRIVDAIREEFGAAAIEFGTLPGAVAADYIVNPGRWHGISQQPRPILRLWDTPVPLWQLALHGLIMVEGDPGVSWKGAMECVLKGLHPRDEWSARPGHHPVLDEKRIRGLSAIYDLCLARYGHLQTVEIATCSWLGDIQETFYADGTRVLADFRKGILVVDGERIKKPTALAE